jgi:hypothetical protein
MKQLNFLPILKRVFINIEEACSSTGANAAGIPGRTQNKTPEALFHVFYLRFVAGGSYVLVCGKK